MIGCAKLGVNFAACAPVEFFPSEELQDIAHDLMDRVHRLGEGVG